MGVVVVATAVAAFARRTATIDRSLNPLVRCLNGFGGGPMKGLKFSDRR